MNSSLGDAHLTAPTGPNGRLFTLGHGDYTARVATVGGALARLTWRGADLVLATDSEGDGTAYAPAYAGKVMAPWPNRLRDGRYPWAGADHRLPLTEPDTATALHGLVCWQEWRVASAAPDRVTLATDLWPQPGYPFRLGLAVDYALSEDGLRVTVDAVNLGDVPAPYGVAFHPYLRCGDGPLDECLADIPAARVVLTDSRGLPVREGAVDRHGLDLRGGVPLALIRADHAFTGFPDGGWQASLSRPGMPFRTTIASDTRWAQVFTADNIGRAGLAIEPMSCPADAFRSGAGLVTLAPGARHTLGARLWADPTTA